MEIIRVHSRPNHSLAGDAHRLQAPAGIVGKTNLCLMPLAGVQHS